MLQTGSKGEKVDRKKKKKGHLCSFHVPFQSYDPYMSKKVHFLQFCADLSKKSK